MLVALNHQEQIVLAQANLCKTTSFYCPSCKEKVYLRVGAIKRPHFAHYRNTNCQVFSEGETEEHLTGKLQLATYLKMREENVQLEAYLPELQQRPDILFEKDKQKMAIEFQCSPIAIQQIVERTQGYLAANYEVIWILGKHFSYGNRLTPFQQACLYLNKRDNRLLLFHYDVVTDDLLIRYDFQLFGQNEINCQLEQLNLNEQRTLQLTRKKQEKIIQHKYKKLEQRHQQLLREIRYPRPKMQEFLALIYQHNENIVSIPKELYQCVPSEWMIQTHPMNWKYQFVLWIEQFPRKKILTQKILKRWIDDQIQKKLLVYHAIPQCTSAVLVQPFVEWIELLENQKIFKKIGFWKWSYQQPLKRYKNLEEKFRADY